MGSVHTIRAGVFTPALRESVGSGLRLPAASDDSRGRRREGDLRCAVIPSSRQRAIDPKAYGVQLLEL